MVSNVSIITVCSTREDSPARSPPNRGTYLREGDARATHIRSLPAKILMNPSLHHRWREPHGKNCRLRETYLGDSVFAQEKRVTLRLPFRTRGAHGVCLLAFSVPLSNPTHVGRVINASFYCTFIAQGLARRFGGTGRQPGKGRAPFVYREGVYLDDGEERKPETSARKQSPG